MILVEISPYYEKKMQCLLCKEPFPTTKIRSRQVRVIDHDSDFRPIYIDKEVNPIFYNVAVLHSLMISHRILRQAQKS